MAESAVVNASPLIFLSRAGLIDLLQLVSLEIIVPEAVASEIEVKAKVIPLLALWLPLRGLWLLKHLQYHRKFKHGD